jgi:two-component system NarL family sensor kinase
LDRVYSALQDTAKGLRSTVTELHPQVLAQLGLTPGVRELLRQYESRVIVDAELQDVGKPASQTLMYRAARELLANINKHTRATTVTVRMFTRADRIVLTVADDGTGFDPTRIDQAVAEGHIGLGSLLVRFEAMGGSIGIDSTVGEGTRVTVTSPPEDPLPV